jgi:hypothetical protein
MLCFGLANLDMPHAKKKFQTKKYKGSEIVEESHGL